MDWNIGLGVLGLLLSVLSLAYAVYVTRKSKREKRLAFETLWPVPLAEVISRESGHSLRILYEGPDHSPRQVDSVVVYFLRFTNFGRVPIRQQDMTSDDPLRLVITGGSVLDVSLTGVTRAVCQIFIGIPETTDGATKVPVGFNFLDFSDGAIIQVITDAHESDLALAGSIIGMPEGIQKARVESEEQGITGWGCMLPIAFQLLALAAVPFVYHRWTGTWEHVWFLFLPVVAIAVPIGLLIVTVIMWPSRVEFKFPSPLAPPVWYLRHQGVTSELMRRRRAHGHADPAERP